MSLPQKITADDLQRIFGVGTERQREIMGEHIWRPEWPSLQVMRAFACNAPTLAALLAGDDALITSDLAAEILGGGRRDLYGLQRLTGQPTPDAAWGHKQKFCRSKIFALAERLAKARRAA